MFKEIGIELLFFIIGIFLIVANGGIIFTDAYNWWNVAGLIIGIGLMFTDGIPLIKSIKSKLVK